MFLWRLLKFWWFKKKKKSIIWFMWFMCLVRLSRGEDFLKKLAQRKIFWIMINVGGFGFKHFPDYNRQWHFEVPLRWVCQSFLKSKEVSSHVPLWPLGVPSSWLIKSKQRNLCLSFYVTKNNFVEVGCKTFRHFLKC